MPMLITNVTWLESSPYYLTSAAPTMAKMACTKRLDLAVVLTAWYIS